MLPHWLLSASLKINKKEASWRRSDTMTPPSSSAGQTSNNFCRIPVKVKYQDGCSDSNISSWSRCSDSFGSGNWEFMYSYIYFFITLLCSVSNTGRRKVYKVCSDGFYRLKTSRITAKNTLNTTLNTWIVLTRKHCTGKTGKFNIWPQRFWLNHLILKPVNNNHLRDERLKTASANACPSSRGSARPWGPTRTRCRVRWTRSWWLAWGILGDARMVLSFSPQSSTLWLSAGQEDQEVLGEERTVQTYWNKNQDKHFVLIIYIIK